MNKLLLIIVLFSHNCAFSNGLFGPEYPESDHGALICQSVSSLGNPSDPMNSDDKYHHMAAHAGVTIVMNLFARYAGLSSSYSAIFAVLVSTSLGLIWETSPWPGYESRCSVPDLLANEIGAFGATVATLIVDRYVWSS